MHWKRLLNNKGGATVGYTSRVTATGVGSSAEPFLPKHRGADRHHSANIQNGMIMFSSSCANYDKVRLVYNGMGAEIGDEPIIPRFFERFINDWIEEKFYSAMKARDPRKYRGSWGDAVGKVEKSLMKAKMRISTMNSYERESLNEYIGNIYSK